MTNPIARGPTAAQYNSPERRNRRKIGRDLYAAYVAIGRAAGLEPGEIQTALALDRLLYDRPGQDCETPRKVSLSAIGAALTSKKETDEDKDAGWKKAQRDVSHLFCHAYPRVGLAMQTRHKGVKRGDFHMYASRWMIAADIVAEEFNAERGRILASQSINREDKGPAIGAALERLALEALGFFDKLDTLLIAPDHKPFAVVTQAQAEAFRKQNPKFKSADYAYTPPPSSEERAARPFCREDLDRIIELELTRVEKRFYEIEEKNTPEEARLFLVDWLDATKKLASSLVKASGVAPHVVREKELIHATQNGYDGAADTAEDLTASDLEPGQDGGASYPKNGYDADVNLNGDSGLIFDDLHISDFDPSAEVGPETVPLTVALAGSENFDTSLEAAIFYVEDGWAVVPCCQFNPVTGRCTGPKSHHKDGVCKGKVPLIAGPKDKDGRPKGEGYQAASRDKGLVRDWLTRQFPDAGVALRLDRATPEGQETNILLDYDVKDGAPGLATRQCLHDTFDLPETLAAVTPSGGIHEIYALPDDLPADYLGSWTRVLDPDDLGGLDIKVGVKGLAHVEPSRGPKGVYRWVDPCATIATLPRVVCDYLHEVHERRKKAQEQRAVEFAQAEPAAPFDPTEDQAKYFKDMPAGQRRPRLRQIACRLAAGGADVNQIVSALNYHNEHFTEPVNDPGYIARVASGAVLKFAPSV